MDTIFALASAPGKAGISVIRISGSAAISVVEKITKSKLNGPTPRLRVIYGLDGSFIDQALILTFQAPNSFTGENVVELHLHGSSAVVSSTIDLLNNIKSGSLTKRWQSAYELSNLMSDPERVPSDDLFNNQMEMMYEKSIYDDQRIRTYLALAMGQTQNKDFCSVLNKGVKDSFLE